MGTEQGEKDGEGIWEGIITPSLLTFNLRTIGSHELVLSTVIYAVIFLNDCGSIVMGSEGLTGRPFQQA